MYKYMDISKHEKDWLVTQGAQMVSSLGVEKNHCVIDFGCGKGRYTVPIAQVVGKEGQVLAVERDLEEQTMLQKRMATFDTPATIQVVNGEELLLESVENNTTDAVFVFDVLQYIPKWNTFFETIHRVLKPSGVVFVYPAAVPHPGDVDMEKVISTLKQYGLHLTDKTQFHMMHNKDMVTDDVYSFRAVNCNV